MHEQWADFGSQNLMTSHAIGQGKAFKLPCLVDKMADKMIQSLRISLGTIYEFQSLYTNNSTCSYKQRARGATLLQH